MFHPYVGWSGSNDGYRIDMCTGKTGLRAKDFIAILGSNGIIYGDFWDHMGNELGNYTTYRQLAITLLNRRTCELNRFGNPWMHQRGGWAPPPQCWTAIALWQSQTMWKKGGHVGRGGGRMRKCDAPTWVESNGYGLGRTVAIRRPGPKMTRESAYGLGVYLAPNLRLVT